MYDRRPVAATMVVLTAINFVNYIDRYVLAAVLEGVRPRLRATVWLSVGVTARGAQGGERSVPDRVETLVVSSASAEDHQFS